MSFGGVLVVKVVLPRPPGGVAVWVCFNIPLLPVAISKWVNLPVICNHVLELVFSVVFPQEDLGDIVVISKTAVLTNVPYLSDIAPGLAGGLVGAFTRAVGMFDPVGAVVDVLL